jgi:hypothetical protein
LVVVLTDFEVPPPDPPKLPAAKDPPANPFLKKSSLSPKKEEKPAKPFVPECLPYFLRLKKLLKKSSSSWSNWLAEKNLAKISSAVL